MLILLRMGHIMKIFFAIIAVCAIAFFAVFTIGNNQKTVVAKTMQATKPLYKFEHPIITETDSLYALGQFDQAIAILLEAVSISAQENNYENQVGFLNRLSFVNRRVGNWQNAEKLLLETIEIASSNLDELHPALATTYFYLGGLYDRTNRPLLALESFEKALNMRMKYYQEENSEISNVYLGMGDVYRFNYSNYDSATRYYQKALEIQEKTLEEGNAQLGSSYYNIASVQRLKGEFENALIYAQQALKAYKTSDQVTPNILANTYMLLGNIHFGREAYLESTQNYEKAVEISLENVVAQNNLGDYYNSLGAAYRMLDSTNIAKDYYFKAAERIALQFGANSIRLSFAYDNLGLIYKDQQAWDSSLYYYNKSLDIRKLNPEQNKSELSQSYRFFGDIYSKRKDYEKALSYYQSAINSLLGIELKNYDVLDPDLLIEDQELLKSISLKASMLRLLALQQNDRKIELLSKALRAFSNADLVLMKNRKSSDRDGTKLFLSEFYRSIYEEAIDCSYLLYEETNKLEFLEKANEFIAKSKGLSLLENLSGAEAINALALPDSILLIENQLKAEISALSREINTRRRSGVQLDSTVTILTQSLLNKTREQDIFKQEIAEKFPNYFEFKYRYDYPTLADLKEWSRNSESVIVEYFYGSNFVFGLGVDGENLKLFKIEKDTILENNLSKFNNSLKFGFNFSTQKKDFEEFNSSGFFLFKTFLGSIVNDIDTLQNLIIIPDGYLSSIPFDALLSEELKSERIDYRNLPYIHNKFLVSYHFNSSMGINSVDGLSRAANNLVAFSFSSEDVKNLSAEQILTSNQIGGSVKEINSISSLIGNVDLFSGLNATEANFVKNAPNYDIIHLAIHGEANLDNAMDSKLIFPSGGEGHDGSLYPYELYNLSLKAKLVVLSACESGIGKMFSGEGIFSMARAFAFAGSPTIVMSLWKINDNATAYLMESFYSALSSSENIDKALHIAKNEYLLASDELTAHPSNWAALVPIGDMSGFDWVKSNGLSKLSIYIIVISVIFLISFLVLVWGRLRKTQ